MLHFSPITYFFVNYFIVYLTSETKMYQRLLAKYILSVNTRNIIRTTYLIKINCKLINKQRQEELLGELVYGDNPVCES